MFVMSNALTCLQSKRISLDCGHLRDFLEPGAPMSGNSIWQMGKDGTLEE